MADSRLTPGILISDLDCSVDIYTQAQSEDTVSGELISAFTKLDTVWSKKEFKTNSEKDIQNVLSDSEHITYVIRWRSDVNSLCRLLDGANWYDIRYIEEIGRKSFIRLHTALIRQ